MLNTNKNSLDRLAQVFEDQLVQGDFFTEEV